MGRVGVIPWNMQWLSCVLIGCTFYGMVYRVIEGLRFTRSHDSFALLAVQDFFFWLGGVEVFSKNFFSTQPFSLLAAVQDFF